MADEPQRESPAEGPGAQIAAEEKIAQLEQQLRAKTEEAAANSDRHLRAVADGENLKKRMQREKAEVIRLAKEALLRDILPILDNLERAVEHAELGGNGASVVEGVQLTIRLFRDVLERYGVRAISVEMGSNFDPTIHEAVALDPGADFPPNTVIRQQQKGYQLNDRLLRPAQVAVSGAAVKKSESPSGESDD